LIDIIFTYILKWVWVFNAIFNNISVISWQSVFMVEEAGENHWPVASHYQTLSHNEVHIAMNRVQTPQL